MQQPGDRRSAPASLALVQDLANTIDIEMDHDTLRRPADLRAFAAEHGISSRRFTRDDLARVLEFRELLRVACQAHAGTPVDTRALARLDAMLGSAALRVAIDLDGAAELRPVSGLSGADEVIAHVAAAIADGRADSSWLRLKACDAEVCRWVYYDSSPAGLSKWCTMSICGSRAKMRAYRKRSGQAAPTRP